MVDVWIKLDYKHKTLDLKLTFSESEYNPHPLC